MKIDLLKDKGILKLIPFSSEAMGEPEQSEDELIAETLRRRHGGQEDEPETETVETAAEETAPKKKTSKSRLPLLLFILILVLGAGGYYLNTEGMLKPSLQVVESYWKQLLGFPVDQDSSLFQADPADIIDDSLLSDDQFNALMPLTEDIAALADSIADLPEDSLIAVQSQQEVHRDTLGMVDTFIVFDEPIQLSDDDIIILNNRSLMLMATEIIENVPSDFGKAHLFIKRDALTFTAPRGGDWVDSTKTAIDQFVFGNFKPDYSTGDAVISSKYEIIMTADPNFQAHVLDGIRLLDVLANPFSDYLVEILIDLSEGVDDNPAIFTFTGKNREIQYILSSWAESRSNFLLRSIDIKFQSENKSLLTFDVIFFNYTP